MYRGTRIKLKRRHLVNLFLAIVIVVSGCNKSNSFFSLTTIPAAIIKDNGQEIFQYWEFNNEDYLWDTIGIEPRHLKLYKDSLNNLFGSDRLQFIIQNLSLQDPLYETVETQNGDSINAQLIHSKILGNIRSINNLEAQLLDYQLGRYPLLSHPTEFHGFILQQDSLNRIKVYFAASDQPWPPKPNVILEAVKEDLKNGWTFKSHLHNHYEPKSNNYLGILAPSISDAQYYMFLAEEYNLNQAIITNSFHTVEIQRAEFGRFKTPEDQEGD